MLFLCLIDILLWVTQRGKWTYIPKETAHFSQKKRWLNVHQQAIVWTQISWPHFSCMTLDKSLHQLSHFCSGNICDRSSFPPGGVRGGSLPSTLCPSPFLGRGQMSARWSLPSFILSSSEVDSNQSLQVHPPTTTLVLSNFSSQNPTAERKASDTLI